MEVHNTTVVANLQSDPQWSLSPGKHTHVPSHNALCYVGLHEQQHTEVIVCHNQDYVITVRDNLASYVGTPPVNVPWITGFGKNQLSYWELHYGDAFMATEEA